jgi:VPDSG-CTERM motif
MVFIAGIRPAILGALPRDLLELSIHSGGTKMDNKIIKYKNKTISPTPHMKKYSILFGALCAVILAVGSTARASTLNFGDANDLGQVLFGIPSGDTDRLNYVNHMIGLAPGTTGNSFSGQIFNRSLANPGPGFGFYPTAVLPAVNGPKNDNSVPLGDGTLYSYLFAKYDGPNAGSEIWYVGGISGTITIPTKGLAGQKYGLSGWTLFGPGGPPRTLPDGGATAALLGLSLAGLAGLRAKFGRK